MSTESFSTSQILTPAVHSAGVAIGSQSRPERPATRFGQVAPRGDRFRRIAQPLPASQLRSAVIGYSLTGQAGDAAMPAGRIPSWNELAEHLASAGFREQDISHAGLSRAVSAAAGMIGEVWCVPVEGLPGRRDGLAFRAVGDDTDPWQLSECGDVAETCRRMVFVECPLEAMSLRRAGLTEVRCIADLAAIGRGFWEDLALRGVEAVTLMSCSANDRWTAMQAAAATARTAPSTPAVELHELPESCGHSAVAELRRLGIDAFRSTLFGPADAPAFGDAGVQPLPVLHRGKRFDASAFWAALRPAISLIEEPQQRRAHERLASEVCEQLRVGRSRAALAAIDGGPHQAPLLPTSVSHHVEAIRSSTATLALAKRLFDTLRSTGGRVSVVTPMPADAFMDFAADAAVGHGQHPVLAGRSAPQLRQELEALGHRLRIVQTPRPQDLDGGNAPLVGACDVIILDLTDQTNLLWWEQNGCCGRMTALAEAADADLVAFWPAARCRTAPPAQRPDVLSLLRQWADRH